MLGSLLLNLIYFAAAAPTFEGIFSRSAPRTDSPRYTPPYDCNYPPSGPGHPVQSVNHLAEVVAHLITMALDRG